MVVAISWLTSLKLVWLTISQWLLTWLKSLFLMTCDVRPWITSIVVLQLQKVEEKNKPNVIKDKYTLLQR